MQRVIITTLFFFDFSPTDVDECSAESSPCPADSTCANTEGSYTCPCDDGFVINSAGDGCIGKGIYWLCSKLTKVRHGLV